MKILMINSVFGIKSTGRICSDLTEKLIKEGHEVKVAYGREEVPKKYEKYAIKIGDDRDVKFHAIKARLFDSAGFGSKKSTKKFIEWIREYRPDVIHLHNLHGYYINVEILFEYLKKEFKGKILWTLHDCWAFTGHCTYFDYIGCNKWKNECSKCEQKKEYPSCFGISMAKRNYVKKKNIFTGISDLKIITPSKWLADLVKESFLNEYEIRVIHNGVDTSIFKKVITNIKEKYNLKNKKILLGVAAIWDRRKGLDYFLKLANILNEEYQIVLIGVTEKQKKIFPKNITGILKTNSVKELVEWYSVADIFINPTLEDNYPTTNLEAIACGTPVVTFNTGGSTESALIYGKVVEKDIASILVAIEKKEFLKLKKNISINIMLEQYRNMYFNE